MGQSLAIAKKHYVIGASGYMTAVGGKDCIVGLLQVFSMSGTLVAFECNLTVDATKGSYPNVDDVSVEALGRSMPRMKIARSKILLLCLSGFCRWRGETSYTPGFVTCFHADGHPSRPDVAVRL